MKTDLSGNARDTSIDVLRCLAILGIILVHSKPGIFWTQLRNFDVPLMVLLSAVCYGQSNGSKILYYRYLQKRFIRLVIPSWIFLTFYFIGTYILTQSVNPRRMMMCYTLMTPWYFWIIRILVGMAVIAPFLKNLSDRLTVTELLILCAMMIGVTEVLAILSSAYIYKVAIMFIPYASIYLFGMNFYRLSKRNILYTGVLFMLIYFAAAVFFYIQNGSYFPTQNYKYPPRIYYVSYALGISALLWYLRQQITFFLHKFRLHDFAKFIGSHTFWIYLWHIPIVDYLAKRYNYPTTFAIVCLSSISITYLQVVIVKMVCNHISRPTLCKNIQMIFIG